MWFELRCVAGEAVTVKCEYYPDADTAAGFEGAAGIDDDAVTSIMVTAANTMRNAASMCFIAGEAKHIIENFGTYHPELATAGTAKKGGTK
ncbi:hypothetical protein ACKI2N_012805 [Cupriavidus sp. 30B13]|uniref:hypothetical protein n=1 Tax=Cupriavidus sp. 30B13 TaxID=3384241 RepID=UPI003B914B40